MLKKINGPSLQSKRDAAPAAAAASLVDAVVVAVVVDVCSTSWIQRLSICGVEPMKLSTLGY